VHWQQVPCTCTRFPAKKFEGLLHHPSQHARRFTLCARGDTLFATRAGRSQVPPHLHVTTTVTQPLQRVFVQGSSQRRALKVLVALAPGHKPVVVHLTGTNYNGCPPIKQYRRQDNTLYTDACAEEYCDAIKEARRQLGLQDQRHALRSSTVMLWHDRDPSHTAASTLRTLQEENIVPVLLPPRSPDLDPLDFAVFGPAKRRFEVWRQSEGMDWSSACKAFIVDLQEKTPTDKILGELPLRLRACVQAKGGHIEQLVSELKKQKHAKA
jgi:hypothetical protein